MRMIFSLIGLLIVLAIVGILAKKQLSSVTQLPNAASTTAGPANITEQSKQMQQQVKDQVNEAMKAAAAARDKALEVGNTDKTADKPADKTGSAY
jgi:Tfp pilus assembly protein PilE